MKVDENIRCATCNAILAPVCVVLYTSHLIVCYPTPICFAAKLCDLSKNVGLQVRAQN